MKNAGCASYAIDRQNKRAVKIQTLFKKELSNRKGHIWNTPTRISFPQMRYLDNSVHNIIGIITINLHILLDYKIFKFKLCSC